MLRTQVGGYQLRRAEHPRLQKRGQNDRRRDHRKGSENESWQSLCVYFSAEMESLLREYEAFCAAETERYDRREQTKDDYVFRRKGMNLPMTPSTFTWRFKKILKANDLSTDLNVHSLRHTAASLFIASGTDVGTVAGLLGHSQPSTTLDIYTHAFDKNKKAASQIMQSSLEI
jgi:integrase